MKPIDSKITQEIVIPQGAEFPAEPSPRQNAGGTPALHRVLGDEGKVRSEWDDLEGVAVSTSRSSDAHADANPRDAGWKFWTAG